MEYRGSRGTHDESAVIFIVSLTGFRVNQCGTKQSLLEDLRLGFREGPGGCTLKCLQVRMLRQRLEEPVPAEY